MKKFKIAVLLVGFFSLLQQPLFADKTINISSAVLPPFTTDNNDGFEDQLIPEMYKRLGLNPVVHRISGKRALTLVEDGEIDSTMSRVIGITKNFKNMVQMKEPIFSRDFIAFTKKKDITINTWEDFKNYNVGFMNGWKILEINIKQYASLTQPKKISQLFKLLENDRVDVIVYAKYAGLYQIDHLGMKDVRIAGKPLASKNLSIIVNKKHSALVPKLDQVLRDMKADGSYQKMYDATITPLI